MSAMFAHGSLRLYLLSLLAERPRHGYELIQALSDRFGGTYSPSAGTIYPRLAKLEEEGLVTKQADGRKTVYEITDAGRAELLARDGELGAIEDEVTDSVRRLADQVRTGVNSAMKTLRADLASAARQARGTTAPESRGYDGTPESWDPTGSSDWERKTPAEQPPAAPSSAEPAAPATARQESTQALREADMVLNEFRQQLRTDLRTQAARSVVPSDTVPALRRQLAEVRASILATLHA
ncbi:PadR family transcriptional regulator [Cryobacterium sp. TMT1-3]|uniref:PadR family transcriptional regulator n=1 Tax=Cryobacterium luteum TaxID=1424661 RepID=A0A1H8H952_9MICO|nr:MULTISPECIES: helix-turn-helix transcriptional regulator [Cryobacterium]TFB86753.1 PadR family transcriptional regulator [Cryobacterium luteum]TFC26128.1 PadR family transcriptional regulator [Cryobacterium sp. TMT1-3]SEN52028.1 transcriptional regulator, PadR family [Cryobacterium luteum]